MKAEKINVAIIHGIGTQKSGFSEDLKIGVKDIFNNYIKNIENKEEDYRDYIKIEEVVWEDILSNSQKELKRILEQENKPKMKEKGPLKLLGYLISKGVYSLRTGFVAESICDIIGYMHEEVKNNIYNRVLDKMSTFDCEKDIVKGKNNFTWISHSLGTVIMSDLIYKRQKEAGCMHEKFELCNFYTLGSPLALFSLRYGTQTFNKPIRIENENGRWVNIYDKDDPIAFKLRPLNDEYSAVVLKDQEVNTGFFGASHMFYWSNKNVHKIIGTKLAIDWLMINNKIDKKRINNMNELYDNNLGLNDKIRKKGELYTI